jgi:alkylation response protein AidB-like acyl-CoA dehydrogenase
MIELSELRDAAQKAFPADQLSPDRDASWALAAEMGWLMMRLPEELGGLGFDRSASTAIHFEMGRILSRAPLIPAQLGLHAMLASETLADREDWLERVAGGEYVPLNMLPGNVSEDGGAFTGTVSGLFEADMASHVIVGVPGAYLLVPLDAEGVSLTERQIWDPSRRVFDLELSGFTPDEGNVLARGDAARAVHDAIAPEAHLCVAADSLGAANATLDMSVEYMNMRKQFDRPIAMFQALKHRAADCKTQIVAADALLWSLVGDEEASIVKFGAMKAHATQVFQWATEEAIQFHGGIGLTEEHQCHLFMKRAMLNLQLCGPVDHWMELTGRAAMQAFQAA